MTNIPWSSPESWQQANDSFRHHLHRLGRRSDRLRRQGLAVAGSIAVLDPLMSALCAETCPRCLDVCCRRATVWFDFRDLLFLHLTESGIPPGQPMTARGEDCRYLGPSGCRLPRRQRPFVCTWYLCPAQKIMLATDACSAKIIRQQVDAIKKSRDIMELTFIRLCRAK